VTLLLVQEGFGARPAFDMAVSAALLRRVAAGELPGALRVHAHAPAVAFGKLDALAPGFPAAVAEARRLGFAPFERLAGGRAAVYHEGTLTIGEVLREADARTTIERRYADTAELLVQALRSLGVDARVGAVAGEYCPGDFSVNARGERKLTGTAQRVVRGAAYVGTVIAVGGSARIAEVVAAVYGALGLDVAPETTGAVEDEVPGATVGAVAAAILSAFGARHDLQPAALDGATLALAAELEPRFVARAAA
jgi:lipoate-protein ligase A